MNREDVIEPSDAVRYFLHAHPGEFTEGYVVEATVELVVSDRQFRLEAYRSVHTTQARYNVHAYEQKEDSWEFFTLGWCDRDTATEALMQAMSFLWDASRPKVQQ